MSQQNGILAMFKHLDTVCHAVEKVKGRTDFKDHEVYSPTSYHEIEHACAYAPSPVRWFTLVGAMTGTFTGFALALLCDWDWPVVVGGKTPGIFSLPAYVVLGFEFTILFGAIATVAGVLVMCRMPNPKVNILDNRLTDDMFGIWVPGAVVDGPQAKLLKEAGAVEIKATH
jgi:molybdopterin-containing oxidoreductase family membrane subunit